MARRDEREYREYLSEEQRGQPWGPQRGSRVGVEEGCPARELCDESLLRDTSSSGPSRAVADSLTNREGEDSAQRSRCQYQLGPRPILHHITENDANQSTHSDGGQRVGHAMQGAVGTPMMLGESPHALGTSSHRSNSNEIW